MVRVVTTDTAGDRMSDVPISELGGKGVFATEVQRLVLDGRADVAVHSAKDLPAVTGDGLALAAVPPRGDPRDALVGATLADLPQGATVATGSLRRRVQLAALRPDLRFAELRGNMETRLTKVPSDGAIVVAAVALARLGLGDRLTQVFEVDTMIPQVGQGALALETRADDAHTIGLIASLEHPLSRHEVECERAFLAELGGDCTLPAGALASAAGRAKGELRFRAVLADEGGVLHAADETGLDGIELGASVARALLAQVPGGRV
jgi:hydroxymethylbilane synthase